MFERLVDSLVLSGFFVVYQIAVTGLRLRDRATRGMRPH